LTIISTSFAYRYYSNWYHRKKRIEDEKMNLFFSTQKCADDILLSQLEIVMKKIVIETGVKNTWTEIKMNGKNLTSTEKEEKWEILKEQVLIQTISTSIAFCSLFFLCRIMLNIIKKYTLLDMKVRNEKKENGIHVNGYNDDFVIELDLQQQYIDYCLHYFLNDGIRKLVERVSKQVKKDLGEKKFSPYQNISLNENEKLINYLFNQQQENIKQLPEFLLPVELEINSLKNIKLILLINETKNILERSTFLPLFELSLSKIIDIILTNFNFWFSLHTKKDSNDEKPIIANLLPTYSNITKVILSPQSLPLKQLNSVEEMEKFCYNIFDFELK